ncbi:MAG: hypothetical protein RL026_1022 [Pseudomonadota bacterium]|jgi:putative transcriptional regulator
MQPHENLTNQLLVAMPSLEDPDFAHGITLICDHSERGALGIVVNKPVEGMTLADVFGQMNLAKASGGSAPVLRGGPLMRDRGFVVHRPGGQWDSSHRISAQVQVTTSRDVLDAMSRGEGPEGAFVALGYAGWGAGQLEQEILENAWLTLPFDDRLLFSLPVEQRWLAAWQGLGIDVGRLSAQSGHA